MAYAYFKVLTPRIGRRLKKSKLWKTVALLSVCLLVGVKYGVKYGWLASHTHWTTERIRERPYL